MPDDVIDRFNTIGRHQKANPGQVFTNRSHQFFDDNAFADDDGTDGSYFMPPADDISDSDDLDDDTDDMDGFEGDANVDGMDANEDEDDFDDDEDHASVCGDDADAAFDDAQVLPPSGRPGNLGVVDELDKPPINDKRHSRHK
jgi:hypothetical protein